MQDTFQLSPQQKEKDQRRMKVIAECFTKLSYPSMKEIQQYVNKRVEARRKFLGIKEEQDNA